MSKSLDQRILQLNKRYQEIYWSNEFQKKEKIQIFFGLILAIIYLFHVSLTVRNQGLNF